MKDRIPTHPGRVKLLPVPGEANTYDMERADDPMEEGTPLNKKNLLSDRTADVIGLPREAATVDTALSILGIFDGTRGQVILIFQDAEGQRVANVQITGTTTGLSDQNGLFAFNGDPGNFTLNLIYPIGYSGQATLQGTLKAATRQILNLSCALQKFGEVEFTASVVTYVANFIKKIDIFAVGGGGSGGAAMDWVYSEPVIYLEAGGGGGGYTKTMFNVIVPEDNKKLEISVGAGGQGVRLNQRTGQGGRSGGDTSVNCFGTKDLIAPGGGGGEGNYRSGSPANGGAGGSGGGAAVDGLDTGANKIYPGTASEGGSNGASGNDVYNSHSGLTGKGGAGQGNTTKAFGEANKKLYSGGGGGTCAYVFTTQDASDTRIKNGGDGGGGSGNAVTFKYGAGDRQDTLTATAGTSATGGGGGGAIFSRANYSANAYVESGSGGSGIVIIRWNEV